MAGSNSLVVEEDGDQMSTEARDYWNSLEESNLPTETTPESTESITPTQEATPETAAPEKAVDRGDGRDEKGRFASKGAAETQETPSAKAEAEGEPPTQEAEKAPGTPPGTVPQLDTPQEVMEPYGVRYGGKDYVVPGAVRTSTHLVIPVDQEANITKYLGMGLKLEHEREAMRQEKAQVQSERELFQAEVGPVMEEVKRLFDLARIQDDEQFVTALVQYGAKLRQDLPLLEERMKFSKERAQWDIQRRQNQPDPEVFQQQLVQGAQQTAQQHIASMKAMPVAKEMTDEDWTWVQQRFQQDPMSFMGRAGERLTPEEEAAGVRPGEFYFLEDRFRDLAQLRLETRRELVRTAEAHRKAIEQATKTAKDNATRLAGETAPPPPAPAPAGTAPSKGKGGGGVMTREEWDQFTGLYG